MHTLNLGILAHVDAGKTSLTERLLLYTGAIDRLGRVDEGTTRTDSMDLERRRGITIRTAVATLTLGRTRVNLVDTPGHPDFIAEVERALAVLDGVVLLVSAVEGVQPQTRILMRALTRLEIPCIFFVNKIDRRGADVARTMAAMRERLSQDVVPMGETGEVGTPGAWFRAAGEYADQAGGALASLAARTARGRAHPVFCGSAITGAGVAELAEALPILLRGRGGVADGPPSGLVFAVDKGPAGQRRTWVRIFAGRVHPRDRIGVGGRRERRLTGILNSAGDPVGEAGAGEIVVLLGLPAARVGDRVGDQAATLAEGVFPGASLESIVSPDEAHRRGAMLAGLSELADQDPLINLRLDNDRGEVSLSLYGEVHKEVVAARLLEEYGVAVTFAQTTAICIERPVSSGSAYEVISERANPYLATVGLRIDPAPEGNGVSFAMEVELGSMPPAFFHAVREGLDATLAAGLSGWRVTDCVVTLTHSGYWARQSSRHGSFDKSISSTAGDFRHLTALVVMSALERAGTRVCEPMHGFRLDVPFDLMAPLLAQLASWDAIHSGVEVVGDEASLTGWVPAREVHAMQVRLPDLTRGEGVLETWPDHFRPVRRTPPRRVRAGVDPRDRELFVAANPR